MDRTKKLAWPKIIGLIIVVTVMSATGCTGPQRIVAPDAKEVSMANAEQGEREGVTLRATILADEQGKRLFGVDVAKRALAPVLFVMKNQTENPYLVRREHFALRMDQRRIEPALPGRAAVLLRDSSQSQGAAWAGYLVFGILAAPSIDAAEKKEAASVEGHREVIFSEAHLPPGGTIAGYLFFESPTPLAKVREFDLELRIPQNTDNLISVQLSNPYTKAEGE